MKWRIALAALFILAAWCVELPGAWAQAPNEPGTAAGDAAGDGGAEEDPAHHRSNHFRNFTKVRSGSMIRKARTEMENGRPDLRGEYERRRDHEVIHHFRRLAELDAIAKIATDAGNLQLASRADEVRRAEQERFRLVMGRLRLVIQARARRGMP